MMHEVTQALEGGKISFKSGVSVVPAQMGVDNSVYDAAHKRATKQPRMESHPTAPFSMRMNHFVKGKIFLTDPLW